MSDISPNNPAPEPTPNKAEEKRNQTEPTPNKAEEKTSNKAEENRNQTEEEETAESGENSLLLDDEAYVGVTAEYRNAAYESSAPFRSEDEDQAAVEEAAKESEIETTESGSKVGFRGYESETPHPTERKNPADPYIEGNRKAAERAGR